jgi:hypothetical protein
LFKVRSMEPEKQPLLCNGCVTRNNGVTVESGVSYGVRSRRYNEDYLLLRKSSEIAVRRIEWWCEMVASLRGRELESRRTSIFGSRYQVAR